MHCGALADNLLESELFGHERGAFTGAVNGKPGLFELADSGTLFLDEFAEMSPEMQTKLLKVLEGGEFRRVGGVRTLRVDVRVVVATNRDLDELVRTGRLREDLLHRIDVIRIALPPLRERPEDIPRFVEHFLAQHQRRGLSPKMVTPQAMRVLQAYSWPGNVRELANTMERLMILSPGLMIDGVLTLGGFGLGIPLVLFAIHENFAAGWALRRFLILERPGELLERVPRRFGWVWLVMLACRHVRHLGALAAVGRLSLTNYLLQSVLFTAIFYWHGPGLFARVERAGQLAVAVGVAAFEIVTSLLWTRYFSVGPVEWAWRSLSLGRRVSARAPPAEAT